MISLAVKRSSVRFRYSSLIIKELQRSLQLFFYDPNNKLTLKFDIYYLKRENLENCSSTDNGEN